MNFELGKLYWILVLALLTLISCRKGNTNSKYKLEVVTYNQFNEFVNETHFITDAEKFGWSIVQKDVFSFSKVKGANWRSPDGKNKPKSIDLPVTQISFNDAMAYCKWSGSRLPTYEEYWRLIESDDRNVIYNNRKSITEAEKANVLGNVWEITSTEINGTIRLAGGSLYCSPHICNGTNKERELYIDKQTGNLHIGFAIIR